MPAALAISTIGKSIVKELEKEAAEVAKDVAPAVNSSVRKARTAVAGTRGILKTEYGITAKLNRRAKQGKRANQKRTRTSLFFGGNEIPAEKIRGNIRGRIGARNLSTARSGSIPRSFVMQAPNGKKLFMRRYGRARTQYRRILEDVSEEFEAARDMAVFEADAIFADELTLAINRRFDRVEKKLAAQDRGA